MRSHPVDYFLWGYGKSLIYVDKPQTLDHLGINIDRVIADIVQNIISLLQAKVLQQSCDLTPVDYFLWGYMKSLIYTDTPQTLDHLEFNIHRVNADIVQNTISLLREKVLQRLYDLTPVDYFLWGYMKSLIYTDKPPTLGHLEINIHSVIADIVQNTISLLREKFLQRSCDLTPLDYFLWGYMKSLIYADKPQTLDHLEININRVIADIRPHLIDKVVENWSSILRFTQASHGDHMPEILF